MYALVIGRAFPDQKTGMMGIFEFEQAVALKKQGLKTVYCYCDNRSIKSLRQYDYQQFEKDGVLVYGYHFPIGGLPRGVFDFFKEKWTLKMLKNAIRENGIPDVIHIHFPLLNLNHKIWDYLKSLNIKIVITEHWTKVQTKEIEDYRIDLLKRIVQEADSFICVGELLKQGVQELTNTDKRIKVIPNMLNENFYYKEREKGNNDYYFITVGRLVDVKRFSFAIEAFAKAFSDKEYVKLHVVGDGPLYSKLEQQIKDLNMQERIILHGFLPRRKTAELIRESDAFVSASILETFGVPFIEAMACGKPVIGIERGPIDGYMNERNSIQFKQDNLESLIDTFKTLYNNRNFYNEEFISNQTKNSFSEEIIAEKLIQVYKSTFINTLYRDSITEV